MEFDCPIRSKPQLNIAPLIDVVFLLIIFFMLSSRFINEPGLKLQLPESVQAKVQKEAEVTVYITGEREIFLGGEKIEIEFLKLAVKEKIDKTGDKMVTIKSDESVNLGFAVKVMDEVKKADAEGLILSTKRKENDRK